MRKLLSFILVCVIITTIFTGCAFLDRFGDDSQNDELTPASSVTMNEDEASGLKDKTPVQLYFINEQGTKLSAETRYISNAEASKGSEQLATVILKELIAGPAKGSLLTASIPKGTTLKGNVTIKDGTATVDLSKEFIDKHPGGKKNEQLTLYSIVNTMTEIKDIKAVQFKIDGKVRKEFKGSYQIDVAYPRSAYLITDDPADSAKKNMTQPSKQENMTQPSKQENMTQPSKQENITQPSKQENITQPSKQENITQPSKQENITQPTKEDNNAPAKNDNSKDKKTNSDLDNEDENVQTNGDLLE